MSMMYKCAFCATVCECMCVFICVFADVYNVYEYTNNVCVKFLGNG